MKLSEAIKKGREIHPQVRGDFKKRIKCEDGDVCYGTCDMGAAYEALTGKLPPHKDTQAIRDMYRELDIAFHVDERIGNRPRPEGAESIYISDYTYIGTIVVTLNDTLKWPTEKTVEWLESIGC